MKMGNLYYKLEGKETSPCDFNEWVDNYESQMGESVAETTAGGLWFSTIFLGINASMNPDRPLIFETMLFVNGEACEDYQIRSSTYDQALCVHIAMVRHVRKLRRTSYRRRKLGRN